MVVLDEIHVTILVPQSMSQQERDAIYKSLQRKKVLNVLTKVIERVLARSNKLKHVTISLSR